MFSDFISFSFTYTLLNIKNDFNSKIIYDIYIVSATVKVLILIHRSSAVAVAAAVLTLNDDYLAFSAIILLPVVLCLSQIS